jgi:hypothetical protein
MRTALPLVLGAAFAFTGPGLRADTPPSPRPSPAPAASPAPKSHPPRKADAKPSPSPKPQRVYTNEDLPKEPSPPPAAPAGSAPGGRGTVNVLPQISVPPAPAENAEPEPPVAPEATEAYWRQRADERRGAISSGEQRVTELEQRISDLRMDRTTDNALDPNREQSRQAQITETQAELEGARAALESARRALTDLEDEARRKSIPPGWIRER